MPDIIFHSMEESAYLWTVMHVADEKGVTHAVVPLSYGSAEHLALHPFGKMPILQHGDYLLFESLAIATYIDRRFEGPSLQPDTAQGQAEVMKWISIVNAYVFPIMNRFMKERIVRPLYGGKPDEDFIESARTPLIQQMSLIDRAVGEEGFLAGPVLTIADSFLFPNLLFFAFTPEGSSLLRKHDGAARWLSRMMERRSFAESPMRRAHEAFRQLPKPAEMSWAID